MSIEYLLSEPGTLIAGLIILVCSLVVTLRTKPYSTNGTDVPPLTQSNAINSISTALLIFSALGIISWLVF